MKKHDEGYALLLVVVTLLVLAIMSAALMSMGVRNLKNQKASLEQMVDKYDAQGEMEIKVADIEAKIAAKSGITEIPIGVIAENKESAAVEKWIEYLELEEVVTEKTVPEFSDSVTEGTFSCKIPLDAKSESENTQISCVLVLTGTIKKQTEQTNEGNGEDENSTEEVTASTEIIYEITFKSLNYTSYNISEGGAGG